MNRPRVETQKEIDLGLKCDLKKKNLKHEPKLKAKELWTLTEPTKHKELQKPQKPWGMTKASIQQYATDPQPVIPESIKP